MEKEEYANELIKYQTVVIELISVSDVLEEIKTNAITHLWTNILKKNPHVGRKISSSEWNGIFKNNVRNASVLNGLEKLKPLFDDSIKLNIIHELINALPTSFTVSPKECSIAPIFPLLESYLADVYNEHNTVSLHVLKGIFDHLNRVEGEHSIPTTCRAWHNLTNFNLIGILGGNIYILYTSY